MKNAQLTSILMGLTACSAVTSLIFCGLMFNRAGEIGQLQQQAAAVQQNRMAAGALFTELAEYSKRDPQIKPILQILAAHPTGAQPAAK